MIILDDTVGILTTTKGALAEVHNYIPSSNLLFCGYEVIMV